MKSIFNLFCRKRLPKVGETVYVQLLNMYEPKPKVFIAYVLGAVFPYILASPEVYEEFKSGNRLSVTAYEEIILPEDL